SMRSRRERARNAFGTVNGKPIEQRRYRGRRANANSVLNCKHNPTCGQNHVAKLVGKQTAPGSTPQNPTQQQKLPCRSPRGAARILRPLRGGGLDFLISCRRASPRYTAFRQGVGIGFTRSSSTATA